jgi:hypothetical protein
VTLAVDKRCGTELDRNEPGTWLGRRSVASRPETGPRDCVGFALSVLEAVSADLALLIDAGGLERMEPGPDRCDSGTLVRAFKGTAVLGRTDAL